MQRRYIASISSSQLNRLTHHGRSQTNYRTQRHMSHNIKPEAEGRKTSGMMESKKLIGEKIDIAPPKGTRDFYPDDHRLKQWLFTSWRAVASRYGFEEYDAPVVENEALFIRKAGEEVTQQLYNFEDKGGRRLSLRPEMTPSLARMVLAKGGAIALPIKWFSIPQCWRYERMTRGRRREHYQWNMDIWGVDDVTAEAELLAAVVESMKSMGLTSADVGIKINSRKVLNDMMKKLHIPSEKWAATCVLVDKLEKASLDDLSKELEEIGLQRAAVEELLKCLKSSSIVELRELLGNDTQGLLDIERIFMLAEQYGYKDWLVFDASVVRGLAYYTGIVFEGFDRSGQLRAICGGGRYDDLHASLGGDSLSAVGFGFGDAVIIELLKMKNLLPDTSKNIIDVLVYASSAELQLVACQVASKLRGANIKTDLVLESKKAKWAFQRADKIGAKAVVMISDDVWKEKKVIVKNMYAMTEAEKQGSYDVDLVDQVILEILRK